MSFIINVNRKNITANKGETVLQVIERNGIKVPTLCHINGMIPTGTCRICVVENVKTGKLIPSCSYPAEEGMEILTHSARVVESRKTIVELLVSNHPDDCLYCVRNKNCELQSLAEELQVNERKIKGNRIKKFLDKSSASIIRDPAKCILCGRCVRVCEEVMNVSAIDFLFRGSNSQVGTSFNDDLNNSSCINCGRCIMVCPTGALTEKPHLAEIQDAINDKTKTVIVQYAPAISVSMAEEFNMKPGTDINGILNTALRKIGFDVVFDTTFSADLTIIEESSELIGRISKQGKLPMITSCCPGWIKYAEEFYPDLLGNISSCKSPQQMLGAIIKSYYADKNDMKPSEIYSVSIMPCTAKKFEAQRQEFTRNGITDVDAVLTTRELAKLIRMMGIDMHNIEPENTDSPHGRRSSAGKIFGASGGVMEAALRTAYFFLTGKELTAYKINSVRGFEGRKEAKVTVGDLTIGVAVVNGLADASKLLEEVRQGRDDLHFIEIMACPGGCINGGGQPLNSIFRNVQARAEMLYKIDDIETIKVSHNNPEVKQLYNDFLGKPLGHRSHELLHTKYQAREVLK